MKYRFKLVSSLEKIFFEMPESALDHTSGSLLKNEVYSFQLVAWTKEYGKECTLCIESEIADYVKVWEVGYVPSLLPVIPIDDDDDYITKTPGLFPDPLYPLKNNTLKMICNQARAYWITITPDGNMVGKYPIRFKIYDQDKELLQELVFEAEIINAELPKQKLINTSWFHGDSIATLHDVELGSEAYWKVLEKYVAIYAKFGHNMILTPIFTPPLDTAVGSERPTNQLVKVMVQDGAYSFEFSALKRWIDLCHKYEISHFEIAHFYTQWGAKHAPKIMAWVDGEYKKIFGWDTEAVSEEYRTFLEAFIPALVGFLKEESVFDNCFFHISDEPGEKDIEQYQAARAQVLPFIDADQMMDALSSYQFYEKGIVMNPVVAINHIHTYLEHDVPSLWAYYCVSQRKEVANRFMAMPSYRNRILGYQLYKYHIKGFLQWGFNFWFTALSKAVIDPFKETAAGSTFPSGDPFVVYPLGEDGEVICSLRLYVFREGLQDLRAMELLETLTDRETVENLLTEVQGFKVYPRNTEYIIALREAINKKIKENL